MKKVYLLLNFLFLFSCSDKNVIVQDAKIKCLIEKGGRKASYELLAKEAILENGIVIIHFQNGGGVMAEQSSVLQLEWEAK